MESAGNRGNVYIPFMTQEKRILYKMPENKSSKNIHKYPHISQKNVESRNANNGTGATCSFYVDVENARVSRFFFFLTVEFFGFYEKVSVIIVTSAIYGSLKPFFLLLFVFRLLSWFSSTTWHISFFFLTMSINSILPFRMFFEYITHVCYSSSCTMLFSDKPNLF